MNKLHLSDKNVKLHVGCRVCARCGSRSKEISNVIPLYGIVDWEILQNGVAVG